MANAAAYLRSSKDRSDVSIAAQSRELEALASSRGLKIVTRYEDAVESGSSEDRPAFLKLTRDIRNASRGWQFLLVYDTSRIARRRYIAQAIKHLAKKHGVTILYARMPADLDPVAELVLDSVFEAMDEAHSLMSRQKGLAGMAENVRQGWRAGGRAPMGYALEAVPTGAVRDGKLVTKSRLVLGDDAVKIAQYLKARARGVPRVQAAKKLGKAETSLIGVEWNALTYAGHTVWNVHRESGPKRRPRSEWVIQRDTHKALISEAEAEAIITQLENSSVGRAVSRAKQSQGDALLGGLLVTPDGLPWVAHGKYYRLRAKGRGKLVRREMIEKAVLAQVDKDSSAPEYLTRLLAAVRQGKGPGADYQRQIEKLEREKRRAAELALTGGAVYQELVAERQRQIEALQREAEAAAKDQELSRHLASLTVESLQELLADQDPARRIQTLVERVELSADLTCRLVYRAVPGRSGWRSVASPREDEGSPLERLLSLVA